MNRRFFPSALLLLATEVVGLIGTRASAATHIMYQDSFTRGSEATPLQLNGTQPDVHNTPNATWTAGPQTTTDGTQVDVWPGQIGYLPFTPSTSPGTIYKLSADMDGFNPPDGNQWVALGFADGSQNLVTWLLSRADGASFADHFFSGSDNATGGISGSNGSKNYSIVLDTTSTFWTVDFYRDTTLMGSITHHAGNPNPNIQYVLFANSGISGTLDNFTLIVPEPATLGLAAMVLPMMMLRRRRH